MDAYRLFLRRGGYDPRIFETQEKLAASEAVCRKDLIEEEAVLRDNLRIERLYAIGEDRKRMKQDDENKQQQRDQKHHQFYAESRAPPPIFDDQHEQEKEQKEVEDIVAVSENGDDDDNGGEGYAKLQEYQQQHQSQPRGPLQHGSVFRTLRTRKSALYTSISSLL